MKLHTIQMSSWRKAKALGIPFIDVTVKSGNKAFSPSWEILSRYKNNTNKEERESIYIPEFTSHMRESYKNNKEEWLNLLNQDEVAIACYCKQGDFCHRIILVDFFEKVCKIQGISFEYKGEIK